MVWQFFKKIKKELPYDPVILSLDMYQKKQKQGLKKIQYSHAHSSIMRNSRKWELAKYI